MCVLLFDVSKHLLLRKTDIFKTCQNSKFLRKKIWRNALALKSKKVQSRFWKTFILTLSSAVFRLQNQVSDFFYKLFCLGDKMHLSEFLMKRGWFQGHNISPYILAKNENLKKLRFDFVDERALITTTWISPLSLENSCTFLPAKEKDLKIHFYHQ